MSHFRCAASKSHTAIEPNKRASARTTRIINAPPAVHYDAFVNPAVLVARVPPGKLTGRIYELDARGGGGGYRMSMFYPMDERAFRDKTAEREDMVQVRFSKRAPPRRIVDAVDFPTTDPTLQGETTMTANFEQMPRGTEGHLAFENLAHGLWAEHNTRPAPGSHRSNSLVASKRQDGSSLRTTRHHRYGCRSIHRYPIRYRRHSALPQSTEAPANPPAQHPVHCPNGATPRSAGHYKPIQDIQLAPSANQKRSTPGISRVEVPAFPAPPLTRQCAADETIRPGCL